VVAFLFVLKLCAAESKISTKELESEFVGKGFTMVRAYNVAARQHYTVGRTEYICRHKPSGLFPNQEPLKDVSIVRVRQDTETEILKRTAKMEGSRREVKDVTQSFRYWVFTLKHPHLGKGEVRITRADGSLPDSLGEVREVLGFVLKGSGLPEQQLLRAKKGSHLVHFVGSGHAPEEGSLVHFDTVAEALKAGFTTCSLCFNRLLRLAYLREELAAGAETAATLRYLHPVSDDAQLQERVERLGRKVLANWPMRLVGYEYRFNVLDDGEYNASACAGGHIFVNSGVMNLAETDEEIEAILAHEIAHVEQRHTLKMMMRAKRAKDAAMFFGAGFAILSAGIATASDNESAVQIAGEMGFYFGALVYLVGAQIARQGYSREQEQEADIYAMLYFHRMRYERTPLLTMLRKIRTADDTENPRGPIEWELSGSHPAPNSRLYVARNIEISLAPQELVFDAFNSEEELVCSISIQGACKYTQRDGSEASRLLVEVVSTAALGETKLVDELTVTGEGGTHVLKADGAYDLPPLDRVGMAFSRQGNARLMPADLVSPKLGGIKAAKVVRRASAN
jgi:Zn-dependent protease with chaperone function